MTFNLQVGRNTLYTLGHLPLWHITKINHLKTRPPPTYVTLSGMGSSERKRKRAVQEAGMDMATDEERSKSLSLARPAPSEEEVEEFFALIRRIHNVKYSPHLMNTEGRRMEFVAGLSPQVNTGTGSATNKQLATQGVIIDLNSVPQDETST